MSADGLPQERDYICPVWSRQIDHICDVFESIWLTGNRPQIADFFYQIAESARAALLQELIELDVHYRKRLGEAPQATDYEQYSGNTPPAWLANFNPVFQSMNNCLPVIPGYELLSEIGNGRTAVVYKARQLNLNRGVALKLMRGGNSVSSTSVQRFQRGARIASALDHSHVVPIYDVGCHLGLPFITMPIIDGVDLRLFVKQRGIPTPRRAKAILCSLAKATHYIHQNGVVHCNLVPSNVLIDSDGKPRIIGFSTVKRLIKDGQIAPSEFMANLKDDAGHKPRFVQHEIGPLEDVHGLSEILYFLLTGQEVFYKSSEIDHLEQNRTRQLVPPHKLVPATSPELEEICVTCLKSESAPRHSTAGAFLSALRQVAIRNA